MEPDNILEDGELSNDSDGYTPLKRPDNYSAMVVPSIPEQKAESESDGVLSTSSDSDSDSDSYSFRAKKPKMKVRKILPKPLGSKKKKYDVWSNRAQEDSLLAMTSCDVSHRDRSRDVETYDHTIAREYYQELNGEENGIPDARERINNKRNRADRKNANLTLKNRRNSGEPFVKKEGYPKMLKVIERGSKSDSEIALEIADKLREEKEDLIRKIVTAVGAEKAIKIYMDVKRIEADGGMLIMNQSRRRTPGGVYLFLLKHDAELTAEQREIIFEDEKKNYKEWVRAKKKKRSEQMKLEISASTSKNLPDLLTKAELVQKLSDKSWAPKENAEDVVNPPPTPETDGHVDSGDTETMEDTGINAREEKYESDFLDLSVGSEMDMF